LSKWSKVENLSRKHFNLKKDSKQRELYLICKTVLQKSRGCKNCRGLKIEHGQWELPCHGNGVIFASKSAINVFGDTVLTERRIGAGPPVIIQHSGVCV
jgi:hypothetical protein